MIKMNTFLGALLLNAVVISAPPVSADDTRKIADMSAEELENYVERHRQAEQEWRENRREFIAKKMIQYRFEQKYLSDGG